MCSPSKDKKGMCEYFENVFYVVSFGKPKESSGKEKYVKKNLDYGL